MRFGRQMNLGMQVSNSNAVSIRNGEAWLPMDLIGFVGCRIAEVTDLMRHKENLFHVNSLVFGKNNHCTSAFFTAKICLRSLFTLPTTFCDIYKNTWTHFLSAKFDQECLCGDWCFNKPHVFRKSGFKNATIISLNKRIIVLLLRPSLCEEI